MIDSIDAAEIIDSIDSSELTESDLFRGLSSLKEERVSIVFEDIIR